MATVQKKRKPQGRLPKLPDAPQPGRKRPDGRDKEEKKSDLPEPDPKRRLLPPLKKRGRAGGREQETKSMVDFREKPAAQSDLRPSLTGTRDSKTVFFYKDEDVHCLPIRMAIHPSYHRRLENVTALLSTNVHMRNLPRGVRSIFTPRGKDRVHNLEDFTNGGEYICSSNYYRAKLDIKQVVPKKAWHGGRPPSGRKELVKLMQDTDQQNATTRSPRPRPGRDLSRVYTKVEAKTVLVMRNGEPKNNHRYLLNRRTAQNFPQVLQDLSELFGFAVKKVFTIDGTLIIGLQNLLIGPKELVVAGREDFDRMGYSAAAADPRGRSQASHVTQPSRRQNRTNTKGVWQVIVKTNVLPSAGTQAQVTLTVYGSRGHSEGITLGSGDGRHFQPGNNDEFTVQVGNVGELYKIRLSHDNTGEFPGWLCDEITMTDQDTHEHLVFGCHRWLARDEDDQDITRELPVKRPMEPVLPIVKYQVDVHTGDVWGGGTAANIYLTIYGERGDTGVRQLYTESRSSYFKQGQIDSFEVEAVSLKRLKRIIIGHDGTGHGNGWFLEKVVIREPPARAHIEHTFYCGKWLDEGEDDGKIVRELRIQDEYMDDILEKRNWTFEQWKFFTHSRVMLYSMVTGKALRLKDNQTVDGIGEEKDPHGVFDITAKRPTKPMFASVANPHSFLAIESGRLSGLGKGGPSCEFRVRVQHDRTVMLESVKNPLQFITIDPDGSPGEVRGIVDKDPTRRFYIYCKGMFRHRGVITLGTSTLQSVNLDRRDHTLNGKGKRVGPTAQFRVHKVSPGGIRMFESVDNPGSYIRMKDGKIDCMGLRDEDSHFLVMRHKDRGYVTIQSASQRGLFMGMTPDGKVHTTIDTGVRNNWFFPEVVEWGIPKSQSTAQVEEETLQILQQELSQASIPDFVPETPKTERQYADGDWSIHVGTLDQMYGGDVALVAYGNKGNSGQIILGAPKDKQIFNEGSEDEFRANLLKIGKLFKIRLELVPKSSGKDASWKVKDVRLQDLNTKEILKFEFNQWLSLTKEGYDLMGEQPAVRPGESSLPVLSYKVHVYTSEEKGSETDAQVYLNVYGDHGDWGKRFLVKSRQDTKKKFRAGQVDEFVVEAVSLGRLQRCVVGHDAVGAGEGWCLQQIVITSDDAAHEQFVFPCNRWLDTGMEDRKIERTLTVKEAAPKVTPPVTPEGAVAIAAGVKTPVPEFPAPDEEVMPEQVTDAQSEPEEVKDEEAVPESAGEFKMWVITSKESKAAFGGRVSVVVYGNKGKSDEIKLYAPNPVQKTFEPGSIDQFEIQAGDIGQLYKIQMVREESEKWEGWFLEEVKLVDKVTNETFLFSFNRWLSRGMDDGDLVRELPAVSAGKPAAQLLQYQIQVYTGDHWGAGTDANMYITVHGSKGDSGKRLLYKSSNNRMKFQRGQMDMFEFDVVDLGELHAVDISHDGRGHGAGIFLDKVLVKEKGTDRTHFQFVFPCGRWLDDHEDDCCTQRRISLIDTVDMLNPPRGKDSSKKSAGQWAVLVKTSDSNKTPTTAQVYLTVYGTSGKSDKLLLAPPGQLLPGTETEFQVTTGDVGKVTKCRLEHDNAGSSPDLRVDYVKITDMDTVEEHMFYLNRWLATDQDDGQICREMPVVRKGTAPLPILRYIIGVTTGTQPDAGAEQSSISVNLVGVNGDTGLRELGGPLSKNRFMLQSGCEDLFVVEAVSVGKLKRVEILFTARGQDQKWYVQRVRVAEGARALCENVVYCHQWLSNNKLVEFPVSELQPTTELIDMMDSIPQGLERPIKTKGRWLVWVQTGSQNDAGTTDTVCLVLCGLKAQSDPIHVNAKDALNPGSFIKFEAKVSDIGLLFKVRVSFQDKHMGSSWFLSKLKLKDLDTGEELHFDHGDWIESTESNPEGAVELPVVRPDIAPLKEQIYIVTTTTGDVPRADTEAEVFCDLIGQWGMSSPRSLVVSSNQDLFTRGQEDAFTITCVELGQIRKVVIGHNTKGRGQGWFCQSVSVKVAEDTETVFPCNRWLDTGCDDRQLVRELLPLSRLPLNWTIPSNYSSQSDGKWNVHITTAGKERLQQTTNMSADKHEDEVSIVVYGTNSVKGPIVLGGNDPQLFLHGKTDHFNDIQLGDVGEIEKIRVSSGYEGDTSAVWSIQQVILEDQASHDMLKFDYSGWVGEKGGDIRKELPAVFPGKSHTNVLQYYIEVHTSDAEMNAATDSHVFMTLYGDRSDSGRRHLIKNRDEKRRFQTGEVDRFTLEAVDLGDLQKLVVAKGPGKPWLLEKIVIKAGEFAAKEHVFVHEGWIGDRSNQREEIEETIKLTATVPSQVAVPLSAAPDLPVSTGSWTIEVVTGGRRGPEEPLDAVVVFCGGNGESKPVPLQSSRENPFQIGQTDTVSVKVQEDVGEVTKVRLGFSDNTVTKAWYIRTISFLDTSTGDTFMCEVNDWVAVDSKLDGWREVPALWPAIDIPPVLRYVVSVHVGAVNKDGTDSEVFTHIYGEQGSSGRRLLKQSLYNAQKIKTSQVDVFELEAVYLGELEKMVIGHNATDKGCGWFLQRVVVQESPDAKENLFECNKWLDAGEEDGMVERMLYPIEMADRPSDRNNSGIIVPLISPKPPSPQEVKPMTPKQEEEDMPQVEELQETEAAPITQSPAPRGFEWMVETVTGQGQGPQCPVQLVLYGNRGHSQPLIIGGTDSSQFNEGQPSTFKVYSQEDVGDLYKVRVGFHGDQDDLTWYQDPASGPSWHLENLRMVDEGNQVEYQFDADVWVTIEKHQDFWRELPVSNLPDKPQVYQYLVEVRTADKASSGAGTNVFLQIYGEMGDTGLRKLMDPVTEANQFEPGSKTRFVLGAVDLGKLTKIKIRHDGAEVNSSWFIDHVIVRESETTTIKYVFRLNQWLAADGERFVEQEVILTDMLVADEDVEDKRDLPGKPWRVETFTGRETEEGPVPAPVELILYGEHGHTTPVVIGDGQDFRFKKGAADTFHVRVLEEVRDVYKVRVGFHGLDYYLTEDSSPAWFLEKLVLTDELGEKEFVFGTEVWVRVTTHQDFWREIPVTNVDHILPVYDYQVEVLTGDESKAGTNASVYLQVFGERGDTGRRKLMTSKTFQNRFEPGNEDVFEVNAVDLGSLTKVKVSHDGAGMEPGWFLEQIVIKESDDAKTRYVFKCDGWQDVQEAGETLEQEFSLTEILMGDDPDLPPESDLGDPWTIWTVTGDETSEGMDCPIELILYGENGCSQPVIVGGADGFVFGSGQVDIFEVQVQEEVGELYKVRVGFHSNKVETGWYYNPKTAPSWFLKSLKLKEERSGAEYEMEAGIWVQLDDYQDFWRELPVVRDSGRLQVMTYQVDVYTAEKFKAGLDANVYIQLFGERGDSGARRLMAAKNHGSKFQTGEKDVFEVSAVDLGQLTKVKVSHDGSGPESSWFLDKVVVRESDEATSQFIFQCSKSLKEGDGVVNIEEEILLSEVREVTPEPDVIPDIPQTARGDGWTVLVTTSEEQDSGTDARVHLTVYGDAMNSGPIPLGEPNIGYFYSGQTDEFNISLDTEDLGQLRKIRLEHDNSGDSRGWRVDKVVLRNNADGTEIEFPVNRWLTFEDKSCDIAVEVATMDHNWPVRDYVVKTLTGDGFDSGTEASVYVNLIGTLGDSGKRFLVHNLEGAVKFESGQVDTFIVKAVDLGRLLRIQIGHEGTGPGSGWFLKHVIVMETIDATERYVFQCERWLHDEKDDLVTERLLELDRLEPVTADTDRGPDMDQSYHDDRLSADHPTADWEAEEDQKMADEDSARQDPDDSELTEDQKFDDEDSARQDPDDSEPSEDQRLADEDLASQEPDEREPSEDQGLADEDSARQEPGDSEPSGDQRFDDEDSARQDQDDSELTDEKRSADDSARQEPDEDMEQGERDQDDRDDTENPSDISREPEQSDRDPDDSQRQAGSPGEASQDDREQEASPAEAADNPVQREPTAGSTTYRVNEEEQAGGAPGEGEISKEGEGTH